MERIGCVQLAGVDQAHEYPDRWIQPGCPGVLPGLFPQHSGLNMLTSATVHYGQADQKISKRQAVLDVVYQAHPERFVRRRLDESACLLLVDTLRSPYIIS